MLLCAAISAGTALLAFALARVCRSDRALLALYGGVVVLYAASMVTRPEWQAVNPFGPTQNSRFWGIGNQVETLLLAPLLAGAFLARRRFGLAGFVLFGVFGLVVMTDNRLGADGGGAIALGVALAVLGARLFRLGLSGFIGLLGSAAFAVLWIVPRGLAERGPDHLRSAFSDDGARVALLAREPLAALVPSGAARVEARRPASVRARRRLRVAWRSRAPAIDARLLLAFGVAIVTSLLINDSAAYELAEGSPSSARSRGSLLPPRPSLADPRAGAPLARRA